MCEISDKLENFIGIEGKKLMEISANPTLRGYYRVVIFAKTNSKDEICVASGIDINTGITNVKYFTSWGKTGVIAQQDETRVGIYAMKTESGLFEMVTGRRLVVTDNPFDSILRIKKDENPLYCIAICDIDIENDKEMAKVGNDLKLVNENEKYKKEYIKTLNKLSEQAEKLQKAYEKQTKSKEKEIEEGLQYFKSYKLPNSN